MLKVKLVVTITLLAEIIFAQDTTFSGNHPFHTKQSFEKISLRGYSVLLLHDFREQALSPLTINKRQLINLGACALITTGLIIADAPIDNGAKNLVSNNTFVQHSSPIITEFGSKYGLATVGVFAMYGLIAKNNHAQATALLATQAMITSGVWTRVGKLITGRERPSASYTNSLKEGGSWHGPLGNIKWDDEQKKLAGSSYDAFPSGHTATAFSIATVFAKMYSDKPVIPIIAYSAATLVGLSRTTEHTHWTSDVFVGAVLGYLCGNQVVNNYKKMYHVDNYSQKKTHLAITASYSNGFFMPGAILNF